MKYKVRYTDTTGCNDSIMEFDSIEEAEDWIKRDFDGNKNYNVSDFVYSDGFLTTEIWIPNTDYSASYARLNYQP